MILILTIIFFTLSSICCGIYFCDINNDNKIGWLSLGCILILVVFVLIGSFHGFIKYPSSTGMHRGVITAIDQEGVIFNRYRVYLKSSSYTNQSDETEYCLYLKETDLANQLKNNIGKEVILNYGFEGGYIGYKSCGTFHIKSFELVEEI
jgi:hypothetical protein